MIKPIETQYNGYLFRSRLEARWAVFFDKAEIPYEYEPEGLDLNGTYYLPDFYLPWFHAYVEIKPISISDEEERIAKRKLEHLYDESDYLALICFGDPFENQMEIYCDYYDDDGGGVGWHNVSFIEGGWFYADTGELYSGGKHYISLVVTGYKDYILLNNEKIRIESKSKLESFRSDLTFAKEAARQARFEYGETPKIRRKNLC